MATRDLFHSVNAGISLAGQAVSTNTTLNGTGVDTYGYESVTMLFGVGARTDGSYAFKAQDSADNSSFADLDNTDYMAGAPPAAVTVAGMLLVGLKDTAAQAPTTPGQLRRYIRGVVVSTSVTTGATGVSATVLLGHPRHRNPAV